jgi:hypothetical protein
MPEPANSPETLALLERIAGAIRRELGETIDSYPGGRSPEQADPLNRVYRAIVRSLLESDLPSAADLNSLTSLTLRRLAEQRLAATGWDDRQVKSLIEEEPGGPDDWLAFLILSSQSQIEPLLDPDRD